MPPLSDSQVIRKHLRKFRLETAQAILRNLRNAQLVSVDIPNAHHIGELCDAYSLGTLANWLATKYGFPAYASFIESSSRPVAVPLMSWPAMADQYPFDTALFALVEDGSLGEAYRFLDSHLPARLDLLGTLFEQITADSLDIDELGRPHIERNVHGRSSGQFYTPPWVVRYCLDQVFSKGSIELISTIEAGGSRTDDGWQADRMQFKVLDPACGCGNFLLGVVAYFSDRGVPHKQRLSFAQQSLYGIEVDGRAASLCRIALLIALSESLATIGADDPDLTASAIADVFAALGRNIVVSDTMFAASGKGRCQFPGERNWTSDQLGSFDAVVGNPPYISHGSRNQGRLSPSLTRYLRLSYPEASEYKIRTHSIFQDIALRYARPGGKVCLLLPDAFLTGLYYRRLRSKLLKDSRILSFTEFTDAIIGEATVGRWCVAAYQRVGSPEDVEQLTYDVDVHSFSRDRLLQFDKQPGYRPKPAQSYRLPMRALVSSDDCTRFELVFNDTDRLLSAALRKLPPLSSILRGHTGMRSRVGQAAIVSRHRAGDAWQRGLASGSAVTRHRAVWDGSWLNVASELLFSGGFDPAVVLSPKLLVRQTADRVIAAYDESGLYHLNNVHSFSPRPGLSGEVDLWYLDGLMNSAFWLYIYQLKSRESGRALAQIDIEMLEAMPLPGPGEHALVSQLAQAAARLWAEVLPAKPDQEKELMVAFCERSIDRLVYDLYDLTADVVEHIEQICKAKLTALCPLPTSADARLFAAEIASGRQPAIDRVGELAKLLPEPVDRLSPGP